MKKELIQKIAQFHKTAIEEIIELESKVASLHKDSVAKDLLEDSLQEGAEKVAKALYGASFITDKFAYNDFVKKASKDPIYLAKAVEKICEAHEVASFGTTSGVSIKQANADNDPIYARAFGYSSNSFLDD